MSTNPLFLGLDLSTQQLKAILLSSDSSIVHETSVHFDRDLPHYGTVNGAIRGPGSGEVTSPVAMWLEAIDLLFQRLKTDQVDFGAISAISGAGQVRYRLLRFVVSTLLFPATWLGVLVKQSCFLPIRVGF
jgi:xylulokinase